MFINTIMFMLGDVFLQTLPRLPTIPILYLLLLVSGLFTYLDKPPRRISTTIFAFILGLTYTAWHAHHLLSWQLEENQVGKPLSISGYIAAIPITTNGKTQFDFQTPKALMRLNWDKPPSAITVGDGWRLQVTLKRIHSTLNPGSMDFEAWALQKKLRAKGNVIRSEGNQLLSHAWYRYPLTYFRQKLLAEISHNAPDSNTSPWLAGLIVGERHNISQEAWQILRSTGTNHLMVIAGLHIGIIAACMHWLGLRIFRRMPRLSLRIPLHIAASMLAFILALYYSAQAGFSIPTQRASFMLIVLTSLLWRRKRTTAWHVWALAMLMVLLLNPLSVLADSFWLSFVTIALIIYGMRARLNPTGWWWHWGRVQWVIAVGLIPLSLFSFQECSLISVIANSIAIPWLGFAVLPFCLFAGFALPVSTMMGKFFLGLADSSLGLLWQLLTWFATLKMAVWSHAMPNIWVFILASIAVLFFLLPKGVAGKWFGLLFLLPIVLNRIPLPALNHYWVTLLDVGQGLSVVVRTAHHTLLFDTGPQFAAMDAGEQIIVPYLRSQQITHLDTMIISHSDNDHRGGMLAVARAFPIDSILSSVPNELAIKSVTQCQAGQHWRWDEVNFYMLHPGKAEVGYGNDSSCVLLIDNGYKRVLLTADIETWAEKKLIARNSQSLQADILVAPHHGSKTSSSLDFIQSVHPSYVLYPVGYLNRYHFPHAPTLNNYSSLGVQQLDSVHSGAIECKIGKKSLTITPYRLYKKHYWLD